MCISTEFGQVRSLRFPIQVNRVISIVRLAEDRWEGNCHDLEQLASIR